MKAGDINKYYVKLENDKWVHRHPVKVVINPILRTIQFWTNKPYVIASDTEFKNNNPTFIKFRFCRVYYESR